MPLETVVFDVAGRQLKHVACSLTSSAEEAVRTATFEVAWTGEGIPCRPDEEATITVSGDLWGTGFVRDVRCAHDREWRQYQVTFVSRTCDATECSIDHPTWLKTDADLEAIAREFDTLGVGVEVAAETVRKPVHKVVPGETLYSTIIADAQEQGLIVHDTPEGKLRITDKPEGRQAGVLRKGDNILSGSSNLTGRHAHDTIKVRGQASDGTNDTALRQEASAEGSGDRPRPLVLVLEGEATSGGLKKRAAREARRRAGLGATATLTLAGLRDGNGKLWTRNFLVEVDDAWLGINQEMVIASCTLAQDSIAGTTATLSLKDPRALGGENPRGKSDKAWKAPEPDASVKTNVGQQFTGRVGVDY